MNPLFIDTNVFNRKSGNYVKELSSPEGIEKFERSHESPFKRSSRQNKDFTEVKMEDRKQSDVSLMTIINPRLGSPKSPTNQLSV